MTIRFKLNQSIRTIPVPERMQSLPMSDRGYPVPWFVCWLDEAGAAVPRGQGRPDFRCLYPGALQEALQRDLCWLCGQRLGKFKTFVVGPMCTINRVTPEPPCHKSCARYAVQACPFLAQPRMRRNAKELPEHSLPPGEMLARNPGAVCLWTTLSFHIDRGLLRIGPPQNVEWWAERRRARRDEVEETMATGLPLLTKACDGDPTELEALSLATHAAMAYLP